MVNKVIVVGNLGKDPTSGDTQSGSKWCRFRMATTKKRTDKATGLMREWTQWHNVVVWDAQAAACGQYLKKGSKVYVEGELQYRKYTGKDQIERETAEIAIQGLDGTVVFCDRREGSGAGAPRDDITDPDGPPDGYMPQQSQGRYGDDKRDWQRP